MAKTPIRFDFWLTFSVRGAVKCSKGQPRVDRDERAMKVTAMLPAEIFSTPLLRATIDVPDLGTPAELSIDVQAASDALRQVVGVDIDMRVHRQESEPEAAHDRNNN